ncbi:hypothetical protein HCH_03012 [Hahella chejuensis KCTC 2396]|uniref:Uncharacterized protein n=1 Tax=Hahella chejuensis (strain KCTC 2396) TaxID=349521 RepID=Q2SHU4_HAHCH|nr:hypothetical protein HCH_03012 [Hahella chejuensis KCTC 2396]
MATTRCKVLTDIFSAHNAPESALVPIHIFGLLMLFLIERPM